MCSCSSRWYDDVPIALGTKVGQRRCRNAGTFLVLSRRFSGKMELRTLLDRNLNFVCRPYLSYLAVFAVVLRGTHTIGIFIWIPATILEGVALYYVIDKLERWLAHLIS